MRASRPETLTWKVYIHYREPTYAAYRGGERPRPYVATFTLEATRASEARQRALALFDGMARLSSVGWVRQVEDVTVRLVDPLATLH